MKAGIKQISEITGFSAATISNALNNKKGVGKETKKKLLSHFKSVKRIKEAREEEIASVVGKSKGKLITDFFKEK